MATYTKRLLSGGTNGKNIKVTGNATGTAVTIHTAVAGTDDLDEIFIYATNTSNAAVLLTIEFGGTTSPDDLVEMSIAPEDIGPHLVIPGWLLQNGLLVKAFAATVNVIVINGYVNRIAA